MSACRRCTAASSFALAPRSSEIAARVHAGAAAADPFAPTDPFAASAATDPFAPTAPAVDLSDPFSSPQVPAAPPPPAASGAAADDDDDEPGAAPQEMAFNLGEPSAAAAGGSATAGKGSSGGGGGGSAAAPAKVLSRQDTFMYIEQLSNGALATKIEAVRARPSRSPCALRLDAFPRVADECPHVG